MLHTLAFECVTVALKAGIESAYMGTKLTASYRCYHWCTEYNVLLFNIPFWNNVKYQVIYRLTPGLCAAVYCYWWLGWRESYVVNTL